MNVLGNIISEGMLDIDGKIDGNVRCHTVSIRENGQVRGDVIAEIVYVAAPSTAAQGQVG
ncbi:MAG: polymer-forming cytoskeletal protein [Alphaproteobacteria bacterium]